jgi:hypothetical protein
MNQVVGKVLNLNKIKVRNYLKMDNRKEKQKRINQILVNFQNL